MVVHQNEGDTRVWSANRDGAPLDHVWRKFDVRDRNRRFGRPHND